MNNVRFLGLARKEFLAEVDYYEQAQQGLGRRFALAVEEATVRALTFPNAGSPTASHSRKMSVKGFPFSLIYRSDATGIIILALALAHHARKPDYWALRR